MPKKTPPRAPETDAAPEAPLPTPKRVALVNRYGTIARPFEADAPKWLAQGWVEADPD